MADVDLLPKNLKVERKRVKIFHKLNIVSISIFVLLLITSLVIHFYSVSLTNKDTGLQSDIKKELTKIESFSFIEELSQDIFVRYSNAKSIFNTRSNYSLLLESITHITPPQVKIDTLISNSPNKATLTGEAQGYIDLAKFLGAVAEQAEKDEGIFIGVSLNSVSLDKQTGVAKFSLSLVIKKGALIGS